MSDPQLPDAASRRRAVPSEQRIFSLILALVASPQGLTKSEVLSAVYGYSDRYRADANDPSLDRQFERDKAQVRELGIPVETIDSPLEPGNNQLARYRIQKDLLQMPAELSFSPGELALLRLAALAWSEGSLTAESRRSAMKLEALGAGLDVQELGIAPRLGISEPSAPVLQQAIVERRSAEFSYRLPQRAAPLERRVLPLRLHRAEGRWHLIAHDLDRDADRVFLLSRIVGRVRLGPVEAQEAAAEPSARQRADEAVAEMLRLEERQRATVLVQRGSRAEARLAPRAGATETDGDAETVTAVPARIELGTLDYRELAVELAAFGEELGVLDPPALRDDVLGRLLAVREQHSDQNDREEADRG